MISVVLYGRNDSYGYNLHKRAALSFNCIAELLTDPEDEILFVDYNTPDDFPTFPEAIQDTLTEKARRHLRIFRVRPRHHARFARRSHLNALEPVARNVAVRRSNPANRWILSTNTDMIFVTRREESLTEIARGLAPGHYGAPRMELPETLWESLDRRDAGGVINTVRTWGKSLHLSEIVFGRRPVLFDGPGDFQLIQREDLFAIHGFHEDMLLGWHVDSNIIARLAKLHGDPEDLSERLLGYHCDHTRQITPTHRRGALENDLNRFFLKVSDARVPEQAETWGLAREEIEEIQLHRPASAVYLVALEQLLPTPLAEPLRTFYTSDTFGRVGYSPEHVLPFLLDLFATQPHELAVGWFGPGEGRLLAMFRVGWSALGHTGPLWVYNTQERPNRQGEWTMAEIANTADVLIFDFAQPDGSALQSNREDLPIVRAFRVAVAIEKERLRAGKAPRRFVGINAVNNPFEHLFNERINTARTPFSARIRHGFHELPESLATGDGAMEEDWLPALLTGPVGRRSVDGILALSQRGNVVYGPYVHLPMGEYELTIRADFQQQARLVGLSFVRKTLAALRQGTRAATWIAWRWLLRKLGWWENFESQLELAIEVAAGTKTLAERRLKGVQAIAAMDVMAFTVPYLGANGSAPGVEVRISSNGRGTFRITQVRVRRKESALHP